MNRAMSYFAIALVGLFSLSSEVDAQLNPGLHFAHAADSFGGVSGVGANVELDLPLLPVDFMLAGEYFFPDCDDCTLWGGSADVHFALSVPLISPYAAVGLVLRNTETLDTSVRTGGFGVGAGVNLRALVGAFAEGRYEFMDASDDQLVFRLGVRF